MKGLRSKPRIAYMLGRRYIYQTFLNGYVEMTFTREYMPTSINEVASDVVPATLNLAMSPTCESKIETNWEMDLPKVSTCGSTCEFRRPPPAT